MKVKMLVSIAGHAEPLYDLKEFSFMPGEVIELDPTLADFWIAGGLAEAVPEAVEEPKSKRKKDSE